MSEERINVVLGINVPTLERAKMRRWKMPGCGSQAAALKWFAIIILGQN